MWRYTSLSLRRKLELVRSNMRIRTVRLVGYCLEEKE